MEPRSTPTAPRALTSWKRVGNALLALGGCLLAALMVYSLAQDGAGRLSWGDWGRSRAAAEVFVFFPDRILWTEFRQGIEACRRRGIVRIVRSEEKWVEVETAKYRHRVRFVLDDARGVRETKEAVDRIMKRPAPPVAVAGSSNTVLTVALAEALRQYPRDRGNDPLLLVPWATAVLAERAEPGHGPVALLDIDPDRTFRFCPNNQSQADLLTRALLAHDRGAKPSRVDTIVDRSDPYSGDLADSFHRTIERRLPSTELVEHGEAIPLPGLWNVSGLSSAEEEALAESIWRTADAMPKGATHWVILPLQTDPARRLLVALQRHAHGHPAARRDGTLRVLCGDGVGVDTLGMLAGQLSFPVWCFSSGLAPGAGMNGADPVLHTDAAVLAEVVAAVAHGLDDGRTDWRSADGLRRRLRGMRLSADDPATLGRSIALSPSGERMGADLGYVLVIRPGDTSVYALAEDSSGTWGALRAVPPPVDAERP